MRFYRVAAVRAEQHDSAARFEYAYHFADGGAVVLHVFDHLMAENQVEHVGKKRKKFPSRVENVRRVRFRFARAVEVVFQSDHRSTELREALHIHPDAASVFENDSFDAFACGARDHLEPSLLPGSPHIRRFAAQSGFFKVDRWHEANYILQVFIRRAKMPLHVELRSTHWKVG